MAKQLPITLTGTIINCRSNAMFDVELENKCVVLCTPAGRLRINNINLTVMDKVDIEVSIYDYERGRIVWVHRN